MALHERGAALDGGLKTVVQTGTEGSEVDHAPGGNTETDEEANDGSSRTSGDADGREEGTVDAKSSASAKADESPAGEGTTEVSMEEGATDAATEADTTESRGSGAGGIHGATESRERKSATTLERPERCSIVKRCSLRAVTRRMTRSLWD